MKEYIIKNELDCVIAYVSEDELKELKEDNLIKNTDKIIEL